MKKKRAHPEINAHLLVHRYLPICYANCMWDSISNTTKTKKVSKPIFFPSIELALYR